MQNLDKNKHEIGNRFRIFREIIDRTPDQLAAELGVLPVEIIDIEAGRVYPGVLCLYHLHRQYRLNVNWLLGRLGDIFDQPDDQETGDAGRAYRPADSLTGRLAQYRELFELMDIPLVEESIMATLLELKALLKKQTENRKRA